MTSAPPTPSRRRGTLILADISGFTGFMTGVAMAHVELIVEADAPPPAYQVLSHLLVSMVDSLAPTFRLAKLEGDAVFATTAADTGAEDILEAIHRCYAAFRTGLSHATSLWQCSCAACARLGELDLKFIVHHGTYVAQPIAGQEELLGPDVNLVHRLLKNGAREVVGAVPYALFTTAAVEALVLSTSDMTELREVPDGTVPLTAHLLPLPAAGVAPPPAART